MSKYNLYDKDYGIFLTVTFLRKVIVNESFTSLKQNLDLDYLKELIPSISKILILFLDWSNNLNKITEVSFESKAEKKKEKCDMSDTTSFFKVLNKSIADADKHNKSNQNSKNIMVYVKVEEKRIESIRTEKSSLLEKSANEGKKTIHMLSSFLEHSNNEQGNSLKKNEKSEKRFEEIIPLIDDSCDINNISRYYSNYNTSTNKASSIDVAKADQKETQKKEAVTKVALPQTNEKNEYASNLLNDSKQSLKKEAKKCIFNSPKDLASPNLTNDEGLRSEELRSSQVKIQDSILIEGKFYFSNTQRA